MDIPLYWAPQEFVISPLSIHMFVCCVHVYGLNGSSSLKSVTSKELMIKLRPILLLTLILKLCKSNFDHWFEYIKIIDFNQLHQFN